MESHITVSSTSLSVLEKEFLQQECFDSCFSIFFCSRFVLIDFWNFSFFYSLFSLLLSFSTALFLPSAENLGHPLRARFSGSFVPVAAAELVNDWHWLIPLCVHAVQRKAGITSVCWAP